MPVLGEGKTGEERYLARFNTLAATCTHMAARFGKSASRRVPIWRLFKCVLLGLWEGV